MHFCQTPMPSVYYHVSDMIMVLSCHC